MSKRLVVFIILVLAVSGALFFIFHKSSAPLEQRTADSNESSSVAFILPASQPDYFPLRDFNVGQPTINARAAVLFDTHSGRFLYQKDIYKPLPIASLTKLMTAVVLLENVDLNRDIVVPVEDLNVDGNGADLVKGEKIRGNDLLKLMLIESSNDAALVFGTEAQKQGVDLVKKMNDKAVALGMNSTKFTNPAGLDDDALSTAADLIKLVEYISKYHKPIWNILKTESLDITSSDDTIIHHIVNTDQLLGKIPDIIGGKTGFTPAAMGMMILVTNVDNAASNLIGVILGSSDRFSEIRQLIEWGRMAYRWH